MEVFQWSLKDGTNVRVCCTTWDWKSNLEISELNEMLTALQDIDVPTKVHAYDGDTGGDSNCLILSTAELSDSQVQEVMDLYFEYD